MKKGLIISLKHSEARYEARRVYEEAIKVGLEVDWFEYEDFKIEFPINGKYKLTWQQKTFQADSYQWVYLRPTHYGAYGEYGDLKMLLLREFKLAGVKIANFNSQLQWLHFSKIIQYGIFTEKQISIIHSWNFAQANITSFRQLYPLIIKKGLSSMGSDVFKVNSEKDLMEVVKKYGWGNMLIQEFIPIQEDYRIMVVGSKAIGVMGRGLATNSYLTNISNGGKARKMVMTDEFATIAEKVAKACNLDHCGVDVLRDQQGSLRVLEANRLPQFQGFEKISGINVAKKVLDYLRG